MESFAPENQANNTGDMDSTLVAGVWKVHLHLQFDAQAAETTAASDVAESAAALAAATSSIPMDDDEAAAAPTNVAEDASNLAQAKAVTRIIDDPVMTTAAKQQEISTLFKCWGTQHNVVSPFKSSSRSSPGLSWPSQGSGAAC